MTMAEQQGHLSEKNTSPEIQPEVMLDQVLARLRQDAVKLAANEHPSLQSAFREANPIISKAREALSQIPEYDKIELVASGLGIVIPDVEITKGSDESDNDTIIIKAKGNRMRDLSFGEEVGCSVEGISSFPLPNQDASGFTIRVGLSVLMTNVEQRHIPLRQAVFNPIEARIYQHGIIFLDDENDLQVDSLRNKEGRAEISLRLAKLGIANSQFSHYLHKLGRALHNERKDTFIEMNRIKIIHKLGTQAWIESLKSVKHGEVVSDAIYYGFGKNRFMGVKYVDYVTPELTEERDVRGHLVQVLVPDGTGMIEEPTLVLEAYDDAQKEKAFRNIPIDSIHELTF